MSSDMAQESEHVKKLTAARERIADALASEYKGGHTEGMRYSFIVGR